MARGMTKTMVVLLATIIMVMKGIAAKTYTVGDASGWIVPTLTDFYSDWAAKQTFAVGDILEFGFSTGTHTVAIVTLKDAYDECDPTLDDNAVIIIQGPAKYTLNSTGKTFFFCTIGAHCTGGQKFVVDIPTSGDAEPPMGSDSPSSAPSPSPSQSPPADVTSPKQENASPVLAPLTLSTLSVLFVALVTVLLH